MNNEIQKHLEKMKNDLMSLKYVTGVDYDLTGYADGIYAPIIIVDYDIPEDIEIKKWFNEKSKLKRDVIKTIENNGVIIEKEEFEDNDTYFYIVSYKTNWELKKESLKDGWKPESDLYIRQINEIRNNLNISEYEIRKEGDSIKFRYNGKVYFAEPVAMYQVDIFDDNHNQIGWGVMTNKIKEEVFTDYISNKDFIYELVGGEYTGIYSIEELENLGIIDGSNQRSLGGRKELYKQPTLRGYLGPMWNGTKDGKGVIRYETQQVYNSLSESRIVEDRIVEDRIVEDRISELNTGVLPIISVDLYSLVSSGMLDSVPEDKFSELDFIIMQVAPKYIEDTLRKVLPSIKIEALKVYHPKQYNFGGDELEFKLTVLSSELENLKNEVIKEKDFEIYLKNNYSSHSGFISTMPSNIEEFNNALPWQQLVQVLMYALEKLDIDLDKVNEEYLNEFLEIVNTEYYEDEEENLNEAKFKDKVKAIKKSLKKNDKRLSDKTAQKSAERIAGSMIKNEDKKLNEDDISELEVLANDIIDFMGSDMGTYFDELQGNEEEIFYETLAILESKDKNEINILIDNIQEADIDEETAEEVDIKSSKNLVRRLKELLKDKKTEGIINPPEIQQEIGIQESEDEDGLDTLSNLQERIGQQMEVGRFNALLQNIFNMYNKTFILPTDLYNMDLDSTQELVVADDVDGELQEYIISYDIIDIDSGIIEIVDVSLS